VKFTRPIKREVDLGPSKCPTCDKPQGGTAGRYIVKMDASGVSFKKKHSRKPGYTVSWHLIYNVAARIDWNPLSPQARKKLQELHNAEEN